MKRIKYVSFLVVGLITIYILGPAPSSPFYTSSLFDVPSLPIDLEKYIETNEKKHAPIKPGNEAKIIWHNDSLKNKTAYSLVYLHGFSASHEEGNPIHLQIAKEYGMNLFLTRLADHGRVNDEPLSGFTATRAWEDAKTALAIGKTIGDKVILMSTSTGGTLSLMLSAQFPEIHAQILMSPNIAIKDHTAFLLNNHWGLQIARKVIGGQYRIVADTTTLYAKYWNPKYRIEALVELEELIESTMNENTFKKVNQPTLLMYYYKDEFNQDPVVSVDAMKKMFSAISTHKDLKIDAPLPNVGNHVIASYVKSKDLVAVRLEIEKFMDTVLKLPKISHYFELKKH
jgi:esterase/lipase